MPTASPFQAPQALPHPASQRGKDPSRSPALAIAQDLLKRHWGYEGFRPGQGEIIQAQLQGQDLLAVLPTGSGKSLCFQLPALCRRGVTLVITPLIALMEDQVANLQQRGLAAASLHSQLSPAIRSQTLRELRRLKLLYLSPETLLSPQVWQQLKLSSLEIAALVIDEAHCLTQWGDSFRPAYDRLGAVREALLKSKPSSSHFPVAAFTATADLATRTAICQSLRLHDPQQVVRSPHRPNIDLQVQRIWTPRQRDQRTFAFLRSQQSNHTLPSGLIYVRSRRETEALAKRCCQAGFDTVAYHGGLSPQRRRQIEQAWLAGAAAPSGLAFVICTSAFGMGVDLPSCRWVLHYHLPLLLAEYVQEMGRAGRDGKPAVALALASEATGWFDPSDRQRNRHFLDQLAQQERRCLALAKRLPTQGHLSTVTQQYPEAALTLALLHRRGRLNWIDPFCYQLISSPAEATLPQGNLTASHRAMASFLAHREDPWGYLVHCFG